MAGLVATALLGAVPHKASAAMHQVAAWLANDRQGTVTQANGLNGRSDARLRVDAAGHRLKVIQDGNTVLVEDLDTGKISSVDTGQLTVGGSTSVSTAGTQILAGANVAYLVDNHAGTVQQLDPDTLAAVGSPVGKPALAAPLGGAQVGGDGTLWVGDDATGRLVPVRGGRAGAAVPIGKAGDTLNVTMARGRPAVVDATAATMTLLATDGSRTTTNLPSEVSTSSSVLAPPSTDGSTVPLLMKPSNQLVLVNTAKGQASTVAMSGLGKHTLDPPLILGKRVYLPDETGGALVAYNTATGAQDGQISVGSGPGPIDAFVQDGVLWANNPDGSKAVCVNQDGTSYPVDKYQTGVAGGPHPSHSAGAPGSSGASGSRQHTGGGSQHGSTLANGGAPQPGSGAGNSNGTTAQDPVGTGGGGGGGQQGSKPSTPPSTAPSSPSSPSPPPSQPPAPTAPTSVTESPGNGSITVTFSPVASGTPTGYQLVGAPSGATATPTTVSPQGPFQFKVTGLSCDNQYPFAVKAVFSNGSATSNAAAATRPCVAPGAPSGVNAGPRSGTADQLNVAWNTSSDGGGTVTYKVTANGNTTTTTGTTATVTGLLPGHTYTVTVTASNAAGDSSSASGSGTPGGSARVSADEANFTVIPGTKDDGLCHAKPPDASCYFRIQSTPSLGGEVWLAHQGDSYTASCYATGTRITNTRGTASSTWYYVANGGSYGFGNSLWFDQTGTDGLPSCPSSVG